MSAVYEDPAFRGIGVGVSIDDFENRIFIITLSHSPRSCIF
jgi:hypothetical protein